MRLPMPRRASLIAALLPCLLAADEPATRTLAGELVAVNLQRSQVALKVPATDPGQFREHEVTLTPETRITSRGRALRIEDLRAGEPAVVVCTTDVKGRLQAVTLKLGPSAYAAPTPAPPRSPRPPS
jgi:uncharacterized protein (DUF2141 family)